MVISCHIVALCKFWTFLFMSLDWVLSCLIHDVYIYKNNVTRSNGDNVLVCLSSRVANQSFAVQWLSYFHSLLSVHPQLSAGNLLKLDSLQSDWSPFAFRSTSHVGYSCGGALQTYVVQNETCVMIKQPPSSPLELCVTILNFYCYLTRSC